MPQRLGRDPRSGKHPVRPSEEWREGGREVPDCHPPAYTQTSSGRLPHRDRLTGVRRVQQDLGFRLTGDRGMQAAPPNGNTYAKSSATAFPTNTTAPATRLQARNPPLINRVPCIGGATGQFMPQIFPTAPPKTNRVNLAQ